MQDQFCVKIDIADNEEKSPSKESKVRNRRYKKLKELRQNGFFSEDAIKLRHPLLYHNYLGEHSQRNVTVTQADCTLSQFLEQNLLNLEYKARLREQLNSKMEDEDQEKEQQQWIVEGEQKGELKLEGKHETENMQVNPWQPVQEQEIELQEDNLIDHAQQLFLEGKIDNNYINYKEIDNNSDYDEIEVENRDAEQKYFNAEGNNEEDEEINQKYYTGIQDY